MRLLPCACHWCGAELAPNPGLIAFGFCGDSCRRANNEAAMAGLTPEQAQASKEAA